MKCLVKLVINNTKFQSMNLQGKAPVNVSSMCGRTDGKSCDSRSKLIPAPPSLSYSICTGYWLFIFYIKISTVLLLGLKWSFKIGLWVWEVHDKTSQCKQLKVLFNAVRELQVVILLDVEYNCWESKPLFYIF